MKIKDIYGSKTIRFYDEALKNYFRDVRVEDGESYRSPQVIMATASRRKNYSLEMSDDNQPLMPLITLIREGVDRNDKITGMVKNQLIRPPVFKRGENWKYYIGNYIMPYYINYKLDVWSLTQDMNLGIIEQLIWKLERRPYLELSIVMNDINFQIRSRIEDYNLNDITTYEEFGDETFRIFRNNVSFKLDARLISDQWITPSIVKINENIVITDETNLLDDKWLETAKGEIVHHRVYDYSDELP